MRTIGLHEEPGHTLEEIEKKVREFLENFFQKYDMISLSGICNEFRIFEREAIKEVLGNIAQEKDSILKILYDTLCPDCGDHIIEAPQPKEEAIGKDCMCLHCGWEFVAQEEDLVERYCKS